MSDRLADFGPVGRSRACTQEAHDSCAHSDGAGAGFNPRRLRLEFGDRLCPCACHSSCPVAVEGKRLTASPKAWRESCTCPGAEAERRRLDESGVEFPDFGEVREDARQRSLARKEALGSARARAAGKSRDEIREIYVAELNARVVRITGNPLPAARLAVEHLGHMGKGLYELSRIFRSGS